MKTNRKKKKQNKAKRQSPVNIVGTLGPTIVKISVLPNHMSLSVFFDINQLGYSSPAFNRES